MSIKIMPVWTIRYSGTAESYPRLSVAAPDAKAALSLGLETLPEGAVFSELEATKDTVVVDGGTA